MFRKLKVIIEIFKRLEALENKLLRLEQQQQEMWEETHPRTF